MKTRKNIKRRGGGKGNKRTGKKANYPKKNRGRREVERVSFKRENVPTEFEAAMTAVPMRPENVETKGVKVKLNFLQNFRDFIDYISDLYDESENENLRNRIYELAGFLELYLRPLTEQVRGMLEEPSTNVENIVSQLQRLNLKKTNRGFIEYLETLDQFLGNFIRQVKLSEKRLRRGRGTEEDLTGNLTQILDSLHLNISAALNDFKAYLQGRRVPNANVEMAIEPAGGAGRAQLPTAAAPEPAGAEDPEIKKLANILGRMGL